MRQPATSFIMYPPINTQSLGSKPYSSLTKRCTALSRGRQLRRQHPRQISLELAPNRTARWRLLPRSNRSLAKNQPVHRLPKRWASPVGVRLPLPHYFEDLAQIISQFCAAELDHLTYDKLILRDLENDRLFFRLASAKKALLVTGGPFDFLIAGAL